MYLELNGRDVRVDVLDSTDFISKYTGRILEKITLQIVIRDDESHREFIKTIKEAKNYGLFSTDGNGKHLKLWKINNNSYSYSSGYSNYYQHRLELEELEELKVDLLDIDGFRIKPYAYKEEIDDEAIIIEASLKVDSSEEKSLLKVLKRKKDNLYFKVIRYGISETPLKMRFGTTYWSKHSSGNKYRICLVEKCYDDKDNKIPFLEPERSNMMRMLAENLAITDNLIDLLVKKGIINKDEVAFLNESIDDQVWEKLLEFHLMDDIDRRFR